MQILFKVPNFKPWTRSHSYKKQIRDRTISCVSDYRNQFRTYNLEVQRAAQDVHRHIAEARSIMLGGIGASFEEVVLIIDNFPEAKEIHLVDWHQPNLEALGHFFLAHPIENREIRLTLHLTDLKKPESIEQDSIDFAFVNKLFDLYRRNNMETQALLWGLSTRLKNGGMFFSLDYPLDGEEAVSDFYELASSCYLERISRRLLRKTL